MRLLEHHTVRMYDSDLPVAIFCFLIILNIFSRRQPTPRMLPYQEIGIDSLLMASMQKYPCYLTISLNDQLHITLNSAAINQSMSAFVALSYLKQPPHPPNVECGCSVLA